MAHRKSYQWEPETSEEEPQRKSRSQKKRESTALQNLGEEIAALPMRVIADFPLSPALLAAFRAQSQTVYYTMLMEDLDTLTARLQEHDVQGNRVTSNTSNFLMEILVTVVSSATTTRGSAAPRQRSATVTAPLRCTARPAPPTSRTFPRSTAPSPTFTARW